MSSIPFTLEKPQGQQLFQSSFVFKDILKCLIRYPETCTAFRHACSFWVCRAAIAIDHHVKNSYTSQKFLQWSDIWLTPGHKKYRIYVFKKGDMTTN